MYIDHYARNGSMIILLHELQKQPYFSFTVLKLISQKQAHWPNFLLLLSNDQPVKIQLFAKFKRIKEGVQSHLQFLKI